MLRRLLPDAHELDLDALYAGLTLDDPAPGRGVHVALCMVSSTDGAVAVDGLSGGLGGEADLRSLSQLRGANDVSLVGAGTVRDEGYVPLTGSARRRADRTARGLRAAPRLAIVTASGSLAPDLEVFSDPGEPPLVLTSHAADRAALRAIEDRAEIVVLGHADQHGLGHADQHGLGAEDIIAELARRRLRRVLLEGGPRLNGMMLAAGRIDEAFVTIAPMLVGGPVARIIGGDEEAATSLELVSVYESDGDLLLRYRRER